MCHLSYGQASCPKLGVFTFANVMTFVVDIPGNDGNQTHVMNQIWNTDAQSTILN